MNRFATLSAAAVLACCGLSFAQDGMKDQPDKPSAKPAESAKPAKAPAKKLEIGQPAPALSVEKWVKGDPVTAFEKGHAYVVEFWATWCGPCKQSMPHLSEMQKEYKSKGLTIIGVASDGWRDKLKDVEAMVASKGDGMAYTVAWDKPIVTDRKDPEGNPLILGTTNEDYMRAARKNTIPTAFLIDQKGNLAWIGHPMELDFVLDDVLAGKWDYEKGPAQLEKMHEERDKLMDDADTDPKGALKSLLAFEQKYPKAADQLVSAKYMLQMETGAYADAAKTGEKVVDKLIAQKDAENLNAFAWNLVDPAGELKGKQNLDLAMKAAKKAVELTNEKNAAILDTLARCWWIKGDKAKAVELQKKAIASITKEEEDSDMADQLRKTLKEYDGGSN